MLQHVWGCTANNVKNTSKHTVWRSWLSIMCLTVATEFTSVCVFANVFSLVLTALTCPHSGILTLTLTNPIWVTKTRLVLQYSADPTSKQYKGMIDALVKIYRHEGVPGLYKVSGYCCTLMSVWSCRAHRNGTPPMFLWKWNICSSHNFDRCFETFEIPIVTKA